VARPVLRKTTPQAARAANEESGDNSGLYTRVVALFCLIDFLCLTYQI